jgi:hypothetical protein
MSRRIADLRISNSAALIATLSRGARSSVIAGAGPGLAGVRRGKLLRRHRRASPLPAEDLVDSQAAVVAMPKILTPDKATLPGYRLWRMPAASDRLEGRPESLDRRCLNGEVSVAIRETGRWFFRITTTPKKGVRDCLRAAK